MHNSTDDQEIHMSSTNSSSGAGLGLPGVLAVIFIVLKLTGAISWPWWWVLSPLWICAAIWGVVTLVIAAFAFLGDRRGKVRR